MFNILNGPILIVLEYVSIREYYLREYWSLNKNINIAWKSIFKITNHNTGCNCGGCIQSIYHPKIEINLDLLNRPESILNKDIYKFPQKSGCSLGLMNLLLLDKTFDPSNNDNFWIRWSCNNGYKHIADRLLLDWRVNPGDRNNIAIEDALRHGHIDIYRRLLIDWRTKSNNDYYYLIMISIEKGLIDITEELLTKYNGKIHKKDNEHDDDICECKEYDVYEYGPIITAVESNNIELAQKLISNNIEEDYLPHLVNQLLYNCKKYCRRENVECYCLKLIEFLVDNYDFNYIFYNNYKKYDNSDNIYEVLSGVLIENQWSLFKKMILKDKSKKIDFSIIFETMEPKYHKYYNDILEIINLIIHDDEYKYTTNWNEIKKWATYYKNDEILNICKSKLAAIE